MVRSAPRLFDGPGFLRRLAARGQSGPTDLARIEALADGDARSLMRGLIEDRRLPAGLGLGACRGIRRGQALRGLRLDRRGPMISARPPFPRKRLDPGHQPARAHPGRHPPDDRSCDHRSRPPRPRREAPVPRLPGTESPSPWCRTSCTCYPPRRASDSLGEFVRTSPLGERETKRALFALLVLGLLGTEKGDRQAAEYSLGDMDRLFEAFNDRCSFIYKYISKELGPVGLNVFEKIAGRGPGPARPGLPDLPGEAGRTDRAPDPPPEEPGRLERRRQEEPPPELRRDPGRGGPGGQADPGERARIRPGQGAGTDRGPALNRKQLAGLLLFVSALALWLLGKIVL